MSEQQVDWRSTSRFLRDCLRNHLGPSASSADLDDLAQEAAIRLLRALRREAAVTPEALARDIARKTAIDHQRRQVRWRAAMEAVRADETAELRPHSGQWQPVADPLERFRFLILNFFENRSSGCHRLATEYFRNERSWAAVAASADRTPEAVRQQWSRCVRFLRHEIEKDRGFLSEWTRTD